MGISIRVHWVSHSLCSTRTFSKFITSHRQVSRVSFRAPTLHLTTTTAVAAATTQWGSNSGSSDTTTTQSVTRSTPTYRHTPTTAPFTLSSLSLSFPLQLQLPLPPCCDSVQCAFWPPAKWNFLHLRKCATFSGPQFLISAHPKSWCWLWLRLQR